MAAKVPRQRRARSSDGRGITRKPKPKGSHTTEKQVEKKALTAQNKIRKNPQPEFSQPLASPKPPPAPREVPAHRAAPPAPTSIADGLPKIQPNPTRRRRGRRGFRRGRRGAASETYCRKLAARLRLLVPTGGKVYKSLIKRKKKNPLPFYSFSLPPPPKDCETERAAGAWICSISEFLPSLGSLPPATAALGVWKKGGEKKKRRREKKN